MLGYIDTHAHLNDEKYEDINKIIENFDSENIIKVFTVGYNLNSNKTTLELINRYKNVYGIIGFHPEEVQEYNDYSAQKLKKDCDNKKIIAIGEIGLDYHEIKNLPNFNELKQKQKEVFLEQLKLAHSEKLPIVIHNRDSFNDLLEILKSNKELLVNGGVVHCFNESYERFIELRKLGLIVSIGGVLTFNNASNARELVKKIPLDGFLLETDCPYLTPEPFRGKCLNEPKFVKLVGKMVCEIKNISEEELLTNMINNAKIVFSKAFADEV